jgi:hypothetical protein
VLDVIPLSEAARRLRISYYHAHKLLLTGQLEPVQRQDSYWSVSHQGVARLQEEQAVAPSVA